LGFLDVGRTAGRGWVSLLFTSNFISPKGLASTGERGISGSFVERTVRITQLPERAAAAAREQIRAATPQKTGRVQPTTASVPADD